MKRLLSLTASLVLLAVLSGCAGSGTEYQRLDQLQQLGTATIRTVNDLVESGAIPREKLKPVIPYEEAFRAAIANAQSAYENGSRDTINSDYRAAMNAASGALEVLVKAKFDAQKTKAADQAKVKPATQPIETLPPPITG